MYNRAMIRELTDSDKTENNHVVTHPLQSWQWGQFRRKTGVEVIRIGDFAQGKLKSAFQMTLHKTPLFPFTIGYIPKSILPSEEILTQLKAIGKKYNTVFIKFEPNVLAISNKVRDPDSLQLQPAYRPLFTKYTFQLDLTLSEEQLLKNMHQKTRYNIKIAQKHGVTIQEENTEEAFVHYLALTKETTKRQGFYAHNNQYHQMMWETLRPTGIAHLFTARYNGKILATWILFLFNDVLYYPYGASSDTHREVMASTLMMWETMRWGKMQGATLYDLWGTPGPDPKPTDPYYGFHRFKMGFGPKLVEFVGSYDFVLKQPQYTLLKYLDMTRWFLLKLTAKMRS